MDRADPGRRVVAPDGDPADVAESRETIRLAFVAALQHLPPRQRAVLILCEVLRWKATEVAELLETSVASVNSALQRARATLERATSRRRAAPTLDEPTASCSTRYVDAFERYDIDALTSLIHEDATQSMPPFDLWLRRPRRHLHLVVRPGHRLPGSRVIPTVGERLAGVRAVQAERRGGGYEPWALQVLEIADGRIVEITFFLDTETLFPLFGLPPRLDA